MITFNAIFHLLFFRNNLNLRCFSDYCINSRVNAEPYKENKFQQLINYLKEVYSTLKTKFDKKGLPHDLSEGQNIYVLPEIPPYRKPPQKSQEEVTLVRPSQRLSTKQDECCQKSISSIVVHGESRHRKYKRKKKTVESWVAKRGYDSSSEGDEHVLTCLSMEETYTTDGGANYLAARMQNIRGDSAEDLGKKTNKVVFVRNKRIQTVEEETQLCSRSVDNAVASVEAVPKENTATETPNFDENTKSSGLVEKYCYTSPVSGHLYNINVPEVELLHTVLHPSSESMFNFIDDSEVSDLQTLMKGDNREHQKLLSAVFDALLSAREQPIVNYYYEDTFSLLKKARTAASDKKSRESELKTKDLYVAPYAESSTSCGNALSCTTGANSTATESWEDVDVTNKRKSPFSANSDVKPTKTYKKSAKEDPKISKRRLCKKTIRSTSSSSSIFPDATELLPVIPENDISTSDVNIYNNTNPFLQKNFSGSNNRERSQTSEHSEVQQILNKSRDVQRKSDDNTVVTSGSQASGVSKKYSKRAVHEKPSIPIPANRTESSSKKQKLN